MTKYRDGSMAAAENKAATIAKIVMAIITVVLIVLLFTVPLLKKEASETGWGFKLFSVICFIVAFATLVLESKYRNKVPESRFYIVWFISVGLGFFLAICQGV